MSYNIDFSLASSIQIEKAVCQRLEKVRLSRNITQKQLAEEAGVSRRTIGRMEKGEGVSLNTFIRVMSALDIVQNLEILLPDPSLQPVKLINKTQKQRYRARPRSIILSKSDWGWGDEKDRK